MEEIKLISLTLFVLAGTLCDVKNGKIPNAIIVTGLFCGLGYQIAANKVCGCITFLGGVALPLLLFSLLYYFRMIGAGDVKLLSLVGGYLGPVDVWQCIVFAYISAAVIALYIVWKHHNLKSRLTYFYYYVTDYAADRQWSSYMAAAPAESKFCFSVPIYIGILLYSIGGRI